MVINETEKPKFCFFNNSNRVTNSPPSKLLNTVKHFNSLIRMEMVVLVQSSWVSYFVLLV
jgi:hypothetical protein